MDDTALKIRKGISAKEIANRVKILAEYGPRHAGTIREHQAAKFVENEFRKIGLDVKSEKVEGIIDWKLNDCRVRIVEPIKQELTGTALMGSGKTPEKGITKELLYVGRGSLEDYLKNDFKGKVVMKDPPRAFMLENSSDEAAPQGFTKMLIDGGAACILEHAREPGRILSMPLVSGPLGIPIPAITVTYEDGQYLKELVREWYATPNGYNRRTDNNPVKLNIIVDSESKMSHGINVIGKIAGYQNPEEIICLVAHHDNANGPGANDNAAAVSINIEVAKILKSMPQPKRTIEFLSLTGEEYGETGCEDYVNKHVKQNSNKYKGVINMDMVNLQDRLYFIEESICLGKLVKNDEVINKKLKKVCDELGYHIEGTPLEYAGDDGPFILENVPTSYIFAATQNFSYLHTDYDNYEIININGLTSVTEIAANTIWLLANE
jgi:hypothetical protein